jgi:pSer/pThr/pTyr-binding forkhead associated (FHA) protein
LDEEEFMPSFRLVMRSGPSAGKVFPLEKPELFVGRDLNNDVVINDPEVSRRHARFFLQGNNYVLEDLGSTNGTFINGQRLAGPYPLHEGEAITFGERINVSFESEAPDEDATQVSQASGMSDIPYQAPIPAQNQPIYPPPANAQPLQARQAPPPPMAPLQGGYAGQVPAQPQPQKPASSNGRLILIIVIVLLLVICFCISIGLYFAPKSFWCLLPLWPQGACP